MVKARNQNQDCAMCCNPTPTEVYKHLPGFIKLLCNLNDDFTTLFTSATTFTGTGNVLVKATSPTLITPILGTASATGIVLTKANVTQATSATTAVTANGYAGVITTVSETLAGGANLTFTFNNNKIVAGSVIQVTLDESLNTAGQPVVRIGVPVNGSVPLYLHNHGTNALNNVLRIHYTVL